MNNTVIRVENIGKKYVLGELHNARSRYLALRDVIAEKAVAITRSLFGRDMAVVKKDYDEFWALKDISFDVRQGDRLGIIGRNGAGKSTLLKLISRITEPTTGRISLKGRVASLLEVGTGFHPELSGRENIYMNGAILGMTKVEIKRRFDEIVAFAEIEQFLDTPVKRYSSGMYVRLAFAVAAHLEPEILVVDEVLAVGDIQFQKKCLGKMGAIGKEGRTVLFVSHNLAAISNLCTSGIVLEKGTMTFSGEAVSAVHHYTSMMNNRKEQHMEVSVNTSDSVQFLSAHIINANNKVASSVGIGNSFSVEMKFMIPDNIQGIPVPNFHFKTGDGLYAFVVIAPDMKPMQSGFYTAICHVPENLFNEGMYTVGVAVTEFLKTSMRVHFFEENYLTLTVIDSILDNPLRYGFGGPMPGVLRPYMKWTIDRTDKS